MELDPEIEEKERGNRKNFNKNNRNFNFAILRFSNKDIRVRIIVPKGKLEDLKSITVDKTDREDKGKRRIFFNIKELNEIDYAMELIKQAYNFNEEYIQRIKITPLGRKRHEFWNQLLLKAKEKNSSFQNLTPTTYTWIGKGIGKAGISLNLVIANKHARIEVFIDCGEKSKNKERFDFLNQFKESIEKSYGDSLNWQRLYSKRASRISQTIENIGLKNEDKWNELQYKIIDKAIHLENATKDYIAQIP